MSENLKTIKELADELGVSKQNILYHIKFLPDKKRQKNNSGITVLNLEEQRFIELKVKKKKGKKKAKKEVKSEVKNESIDVLNAHLLKEIEYLKKSKDEQIKNLMEAQKQTQNLLDQQQRLALQDKKLLEEYKAENDSLKALKMPSQDTKEEQVDNQPQTDLESLKSEITALNDKIKGQEELNNQSSKKWYQFWK